MYQSLRRRPGSPSVVGPHVRQIPAGAHDGSPGDFLRRHEREASNAARGTEQDRQAFAAQLLERAADMRNIHCAIMYLTSQGNKAPGPNGMQLELLDSHEHWQLTRELHAGMASGQYRHGPVQRILIPKTSGVGTRPLEIPNAEDKVVQRAIAQAIQPFLDANFDVRSFGFRPGFGREHALATAELLAHINGSSAMITEDVRDAFTRVPHGRLDDVLRQHGLNEAMTSLIRRTIANRSNRGLPQGGPLSPLLLNAYLDHFLDRPWRRRHPDTPLIRVADDLLVICPPGTEPRRLYADLERLVTAAGMPLKGTPATAIRDLGQRQDADWLGYRLRQEEADWEVRIAPKSWRRLEEHLARCHLAPDAPARAIEVVAGWADQLGPCLRHEDVQQVYTRVSTIAVGQAFEEIPALGELRERWERAAVRYRCLRRVLHCHGHGATADGSALQHRHPADQGRGGGASPVDVPPPSFQFIRPEYVLYTDGACDGRRGVGGWAFLLEGHRARERISRAGSHPRTTNNRMELTAVISGLGAIETPSTVMIVTDSRYVYDGITSFLAQWRQSGWRRAGGGQLANAALWRALAELLERHLVRCEWVRGHAGHIENDVCDQMATAAVQARRLSSLQQRPNPHGQDESR